MGVASLYPLLVILFLLLSAAGGVELPPVHRRGVAVDRGGRRPPSAPPHLHWQSDEDSRRTQAVQSDSHVHVHVAVDGHDVSGCGGAHSACATLRFAYDAAVGGSSFDITLVSVAMSAGVYDEARYRLTAAAWEAGSWLRQMLLNILKSLCSCGVVANRALVLSGAGKDLTVVDCGGSNRMLLATSNVTMTGLTVTGGYVSVTGRTLYQSMSPST